MSENDFQSHFQYKNPEILSDSLNNGQSIILVGAHVGNWEWGVRSFPLVMEFPVFGVYKRLRNKALNKFLIERRTSYGLELIPMESAAKTMLRNKNTTAVFVFIADQTPSNILRAHWVDFFSKKTPFHSGFSRLANRLNYPIYYYDIKRMTRGNYEVTFWLA